MRAGLDKYLQRFQNLSSYTIYALTDGGHEAEPWYEVTPKDLLPELVLDELNLANQVQTVTAQTQKWGRLEAQAKRVWDLTERTYRVWRAKLWLQQQKESEKRPTEAQHQAYYRTHEEYADIQMSIERAEEAYNATRAVVEAFRAQREMLKRFAYRHRESGEPELAI